MEHFLCHGHVIRIDSHKENATAIFLNGSRTNKKKRKTEGQERIGIANYQKQFRKEAVVGRSSCYDRNVWGLGCDKRPSYL